MKNLLKKLQQRKEEGALRELPNGAELIDFSSNDYLGFAADPSIRVATGELIEELSATHGSSGSRLISGNCDFAEVLEAQISEFHGAESALIFNSGYDANLGLLSSLPQRGDTIFYDQLSHASIRDGIRLSTARSFSFKHNSLEDLILKTKHAKGEVWVVVESVYSMDGDFAPLEDLAEVCNKFGYNLIVDEAHAVGVFGPHGEGLINKEELIDKIFARVVTFGKALGCHGAAVLGSNDLKSYLINFARSFIYTTALPKTSLAAIKVVYDFLPQVKERRTALMDNINYFLENFILRDRLVPSQSQIQAVVVPGNHKVVDISLKLKDLGIALHAIRSPTVSNGSERLRVSLHSFNTKEHIKLLIEQLSSLI